MTRVLPVTVCVPAHPARARNGMLTRAVESIHMGESLPAAVLVDLDRDGTGAAQTKNRLVRKVTTPWIAFLDSDDWWYPEHLDVLYGAALAESADYVFSHFMVYDDYEAARPDVDPLGGFGEPWDPEKPRQTTTTILVSTEWAQRFPFVTQPEGRLIEGTTLRYGEDFDFTVRMNAAGARIFHVPRRTWAWRHHGGNSAGLSTYGDAKEW